MARHPRRADATGNGGSSVVLIPAIDFREGRVVQLVQGHREVFSTDDLDGWLDKFASFPLIQVIDLDAAMRTGHNTALVERVCAARPCQVGGGIRSADTAARWLDSGAARVIVGSALFAEGVVDTVVAEQFAERVGVEAIVAAADSRGGTVVTHGWKRRTSIDLIEAVKILSPFTGGFLATLVETEGLMQGLDFDCVSRLRSATARRLIVAGGVRHMDDVRHLEALGADAVAGMAIYTGAIET